MNKNNIEIRSFSISNNADSRLVSGYAVVFNSLSEDLGGFREIIAPTAITQELIDRSDVVMNYAHNDNAILARSNKGEGTLSLSLDEKGLYFLFEMPNTAIGDQILESLHRGDITSCSFAFSLDYDTDCDIWTKDEDGNVVRTITMIDGLYDCAIVVHPAYSETTVSARSLDKLTELQNMKEDDTKLHEEEVKEPETQEEETQEEKSCDEKEEERDENQEEEEEPKDDDEPADYPEEDEEKEDEENDETEEKHRNINTQKSKTMEKRFSLLSAIRSIANGQKLDAAEQAVVNAGAEAMRNAGQSFSGQIQLPVDELRADPVHYTVDADGSHVVVTDYLNILEPLKAKNVLVAAGANYLTGLKGDVQIPSMTAENVFWEGEIEETDNGAGSFSSVKMAPRRLSAYVDISKQFLVQDTLGAENLIRKLLVEAINDKLEATILSDDAASGAKPAGIFYNVSPATISDFGDVCDLEASLDENNFIGDFKYVINPKAKAALRAMIKGTNATGMVMENNAIDGTPAEVTTHMEDNLMAYGDWSQLYIGQWGAIDLTVDNYTQATKGCVRLVINAFFDYKVVRSGAIVLGEYTASNA